MGLPRERLLFMNQCHGADVHVVDGPWSGPAPSVDALVTTRRDLALAVLVADCTPVLLADPAAGVVAAVHAGRPGMLAGIVGRTLAVMRGLGATAVSAAVGPSVCGRCYEVPPEMRARRGDGQPRVRDRLLDRDPGHRRRGRGGRPAPVVRRAGALGAGLHPGVPDLYSYRRDRQTGRFAGVVRLLPERGEA